MTTPNSSQDDAAVDWDDVFRSNYASTLTNSASWYATADELWIAAELVAPQVRQWWEHHRARAAGAPATSAPPGCHPIFMMLCGFVVENLSKGALAARLSWDERQAARASGMLPGRLKSHDLVRLVESIEFEANADDLHLLRRLHRAVLWHGRYPVAVGIDRSLDRIPASGGESISLTWLGGRDVDNCIELLNRLQTHVGARRYAPIPPSGT